MASLPSNQDLGVARTPASSDPPAAPSPEFSGTDAANVILPSASFADRLAALGRAIANPNPARYQTWPEKVLRGLVGTAFRGATLPGDVYQGRVTPADPGYFTRAADLASTALMGATSVVPEGAEAASGILPRLMQSADDVPTAMMTSKSEKAPAPAASPDRYQEL